MNCSRNALLRRPHFADVATRNSSASPSTPVKIPEGVIPSNLSPFLQRLHELSFPTAPHCDEAVPFFRNQEVPVSSQCLEVLTPSVIALHANFSWLLVEGGC